MQPNSVGIERISREPNDVGEIRLVFGVALMICLWLAAVVVYRRWRHH